MISAPHQARYTSTMSRRLPNGERRISPTPSEQSFQTTVTNPASLFSVSQADGISDSISLVTTAGHDALIWERHPRAAMPVGYTMVRVQHPGFAQSSVPGQSQSQQQPSEMNLFEFLKEAQLEHYYTALTTHLKIRSVQQIKYVEDSDLSELGFSRPEQRRLRKYFKRECPQTTMGKLRKRLSRSTVGRASVGSKLRGHQTDSELSPYHHSIRSNEDEDSADWNADRTNGASMRSSRALCRNGRAAAGDGHGLFINKPPVYRVIDPDQIELGTSLGEGEFGRVYQGVWRPDSGGVIQVAVKILDPHGLVENPSGFLNEIAVMHRINHPDIVHLYGVCMEPDSWKIVTELAPLRSLLECLREPELRSSFPVTTLHQFAVQITRGMSYLEEIGLVHRDLAARNILVFSKEMVKISDFGMSRALHLGKSYYQSNFNVNLKLPTAWCAPECIHDLCFTTASDVWAYAVTLWEMYTYGFTPWAGLTGRQILETIDTPRSGRLDQPDACPDAVYDAVMRACWAHEPTARPSFGQLLGMLPRLCPERWITVREYDPQSDARSTNESIMSDNSEHLPHLRCAGVRALGRHLAVESNEVVFVLGKRSSQLWKVISQQTGLVGCVPTAILKPYPVHSREAHILRESSISTTATMRKTTEKPTGSPSIAKSLMRNGRRASLSDLAFRKTMSRLTKLTGSGPHNGTGSSTTPSTRGSRLTADKISLPQNDFRHIGHVGSDGRTFGELGFVKVAVGSNENLPGSSPSLASSASDLERNEVIGPSYNRENLKPGATTDRDILLSDTNGIKSSGRAVDLVSVKNVLPPVNASSHTVKKENLDRPIGDLFSSKPDAVDEGLGLDFGSSLLDEVFKCFSLNGTTGTPEPVSEDMVKQNGSSLLSTATTTSNNVDTTNPIPVDSIEPIDGAKRESSPVRNGKTDSPSPERISSRILVDTQPEVTYKPRYADLFTASPDEVDKSDCDSLSLTRNTQRVLSRTNTLSSVVLKSIHGRDGNSRDTSRRSRTRTRGYPVGTSDDEQGAEVDTSGLHSRWKRSTFGSLTRRSLSVSKVSGFSRDSAGRPDYESSDGLRSSKRLTISRPVLITKPVVPGDSSVDSLNLGQLPATSSSTLTSLGPGTIDRASLRSSASRDSSLTIVSAANDYLHSGGEGLDEHSVELSRDSLVRQSSNRRSSISPAPSLSSINQPYFRAGVGPSHLMSGSVAAGPASSGLRALRGGDAVFRAATHTAGSNRIARRTPLSSTGSGLMGNEPRAVGSRLGLTDHISNFGTSRSPDYLTHATGSNNLLSRLDGLSSGSGTAGPGSRAGTGDTRQKGLSRSMSTASSSSSSSSSSPLSPPSLINSPARITDFTRGCSRTTSALTRIGRNEVDGSTTGSAVDNQIASFWGSTFADLLNGSSAAGEAAEEEDVEDVTLNQPSLRELQSNLTGTTLRPSFSSTLRTGTLSRRLNINDDDDPVAV